MAGTIRASVALASYNGAKYIESQIRSVLEDMGPADELVVSDDGSTDGTADILRCFAAEDSRVRFVEGPCRGIKQNFANAISECRGKYIFLADQDNIWYKGKIARVIKEFKEKNCPVVVHDCRVTDAEGSVIYDSFYRLKRSAPGVWTNIFKNRYPGCCMAFDARLKSTVLPIPDNIHMHDQWIGILGDLSGGSMFIKDILLDFVRHGDNNEEIDKHYSFGKMLKNRLTLIRELRKRKGLIFPSEKL